MLKTFLQKLTVLAGGNAKRIRKRNSRPLSFESMERRELFATDTSLGFDWVRSTKPYQDSLAEVARSGISKTIDLAGNIASAQQDHSLLKQSAIPGKYTGSATLSRIDGVLQETFHIRQEFVGSSRFGSFEKAAINADVVLVGQYQTLIANGKPSSVIDRDWESTGNMAVEIASGPTKGVDYDVSMQRDEELESQDIVSDLTPAEIVGTAVRNGIPVNYQLKDWLNSRFTNLSKIRIPNLNVNKTIEKLSITIDRFSALKNRSDEQILADALANDQWIVGITNQDDLLRYAQGNAIAVVGVKYNLSKDFLLGRIKLPTYTGSLFGGNITATIASGVRMVLSVDANGVLAADSRGYGLTAGSSASAKLKLQADLSGKISVINIKEIDLDVLRFDVSGSASLVATFQIVVGQPKSDPNVLHASQILYVTPNRIQKSSWSSYLNATVSADAIVKVEAKAKVFGIIPGGTKKYNETFKLYDKVLIAATKSLRE